MKTFNYVPFICFLILMLSACGPKDDDSSLTGSNDSFGGKIKSVELHKDKSFEKIPIVNNEGEWIATSGNKAIATVLTEENQLIIIGVAQGETTVNVQDSKGKKSSVNVTVDYNLIRPVPPTELIIVRKGDSRSINVESGLKIRVKDGKDNISFNLLDDNKLRIEGKQLGQSLIACKLDYWSKNELNIVIVDKYPLEVIENITITQRPGKVQRLIQMGNGNYRVESADPSIAIGRILPYEGPYNSFLHNEAILEVESFDKRGTTTLTVTDGMNVSKTIMISVY
ncbi:MAG: hypothetical protein ACRCZQ_00360 [Bacteroidales bacterium]